MTRRVIPSITVCILLLSPGLPRWGSAGLPADKVDHSLYGELLGKYVKNGVVDYRGFKNEEAVLDRYLSILEKTDTKTLSRNEQFAFYINAYNAWTIKLILGGDR